MTQTSQLVFMACAVGFIPALIFGFMLFSFVKTYKLKKLIQNTPTSKIGFLKSGFVEICGKILAQDQMITAPIKGTHCVYYDFRIEEWKRSGKHHRWVAVVKDKQHTPFWIQDETGRALIKIEEAETLFDEDSKIGSGGTLDASTPESLLDAIAQKYGYNRKGWLFDKKIRYRESVLEAGDQIYVLGSAHVGVDGPVLQKEKGGVLIVADSSETKALKKLNIKLLSYGIVALILFAFAVIALTALFSSR